MVWMVSLLHWLSCFLFSPVDYTWSELFIKMKSKQSGWNWEKKRGVPRSYSETEWGASETTLYGIAIRYTQTCTHQSCDWVGVGHRRYVQHQIKHIHGHSERRNHVTGFMFKTEHGIRGNNKLFIYSFHTSHKHKIYTSTYCVRYFIFTTVAF